MKNILIKGLFVSTAITLATSSVSALTCTNLTKALSKGSENSEVLKLQQFLFDSGYLTAKPNGYFGAGTVVAVKKFQGANGLSQAGSVGPASRNKIKYLSCKISVVNSDKSTNITKIVATTTLVDDKNSKTDRYKKFASITILKGWFDNFEVDNRGRLPNDLNELKKYLTDSGIFDDYINNITYTILNAKENKYKLCSQFVGETFTDISIFNKKSNEVYSVQSNNLCLTVSDPSKNSIH